MDKQLIFKVTKMEKMSKGYYQFTIEIVDEYTLQWMEKRYPGKMTTDGRIFTLRFSMKMDNAEEIDDIPAELTRLFVLERMKGNI